MTKINALLSNLKDISVILNKDNIESYLLSLSSLKKECNNQGINDRNINAHFEYANTYYKKMHNELHEGEDKKIFENLCISSIKTDYAGRFGAF